MDPIWIIVILAAIAVPVAIHRLTAREERAPRPAPASDLEHLAADVRALLDAGNRIGAIQRLRETTGAGLAESKHAVESSEQSGRLVLTLEAGPAAVSGDVESEARALARSGRQIDAIRLVRERAGIGLKEAKNYVDRLV